MLYYVNIYQLCVWLVSAGLVDKSDVELIERAWKVNDVIQRWRRLWRPYASIPTLPGEISNLAGICVCPLGYSGNVDGVYRGPFKDDAPISEARLTVYFNRRPFFAILFVRAC